PICQTLPDIARRCQSLPLDWARAFHAFDFQRKNNFQLEIHHQVYHQDVVAYQLQRLPDSARKIII
ncbi:MAG: hypothetical protein WCK93_13485, partial [Nitrosomonadales bacterium]